MDGVACLAEGRKRERVRLGSSSYADAFATRRARLAQAGEVCEGWRPGLDLNQDKEHCIALASTLSATGPIASLLTPARLATSGRD